MRARGVTRARFCGSFGNDQVKIFNAGTVGELQAVAAPCRAFGYSEGASVVTDRKLGGVSKDRRFKLDKAVRSLCLYSKAWLLYLELRAVGDSTGK